MQVYFYCTFLKYIAAVINLIIPLLISLYPWERLAGSEYIDKRIRLVNKKLFIHLRNS